MRLLDSRIVVAVIVAGCAPKGGGTESEGTTNDTLGDVTSTTGSSGTTGGGLTTTTESPTTGSGLTTGAEADSEEAPGPEEACAAWCTFNVRCSDITPDSCAMICAQTFEDISTNV